MLTVLTGPMVIHSVWQHEHQLAEMITLKSQDGPYLNQSQSNGRGTATSVMHAIHGGDQVTWILRVCSTEEGVLDVETELSTVGDLHAATFPVSWSRQVVVYGAGGCQNVVIRTIVPASTRPGRYELWPELRMELESGHTLVGGLAPLPFVVSGGQAD
ncbi:MAG: hypothetical protein ACREF3_03860 [Acetobacteraceae bacterium]